MSKAKRPSRPRAKRAAARALTVVAGTGDGTGGSVTTRLTEVGMEALEQLAALGLRKKSIAARLGLGCHKTLDRALAEQPEAALAFARGRADLEEELAGCLVAQARKGNIAATIFGLKNLGWSDTPRAGEGEADPRVAIQINLPSPKTVEEYMRTIGGQTDG